MNTYSVTQRDHTNRLVKAFFWILVLPAKSAELGLPPAAGCNCWTIEDGWTYQDDPPLWAEEIRLRIEHIQWLESKYRMFG